MRWEDRPGSVGRPGGRGRGVVWDVLEAEGEVSRGCVVVGRGRQAQVWSSGNLRDTG